MDNNADKIERFKTEHRVSGFTLHDNCYSIRFWIDRASYHLVPYCSGSLCNYPDGFSVYRKKRKEEKEYLFTFLEFVSDDSTPETIRYNEMLRSLKKDDPDIGQQDYIPYIIWHMAEEMGI